MVFPNHDCANPEVASRLITDFIQTTDLDVLDLNGVAKTECPAFDTPVGQE